MVSKRLWRIGAAVAAVVVVVGAGAAMVRAHELKTRLLVTDPNDVPAHPELVAYAASLARPAYRKDCASCHGAKMQGDHAKGAPSLNDKVWLYGSGDVAGIEQTILYGIRSGNAKAHNITDMPAFGRTMQLSDAEIADVETYVLSLTRHEADQGAVERGSRIFQTKGSCYDCHSSDAKGNPDYGAPDFTDAEWLYGGDPATVHESIYDGRHGLCPAWIGKLKPAVIRALAVYLHQASFAPPPARSQAHG
ncbi:MAG: c-type cytochrome [Caulobacteraceae bacterium]